MLTIIHPEDTGKNKEGNGFKDLDNISPLLCGHISLTMGNYGAESGVLIRSGEGSAVYRSFEKLLPFLFFPVHRGFSNLCLSLCSLNRILDLRHDEILLI